MKFRNRLLKKWKNDFERDLYKSAYDQGRFDYQMEQLIRKDNEV